MPTLYGVTSVLCKAKEFFLVPQDCVCTLSAGAERAVPYVLFSPTLLLAAPTCSQRLAVAAQMTTSICLPVFRPLPASLSRLQ